MGNAKRIDMESYARRDHFEYFKSMGYPYVGVTCNVDITKFMERIRAERRPFFLSFLWEAAGAANAVEQLRQRIAQDGGILEFDSCDTSHTVAKEDGTYSYCRLDCSRPLSEFLPYAAGEQARIRAEGDIDDGDEALSLFFISSVPWFSYTSLVQPVPSPADSNPRITWGRYEERGGRIRIPVSILCHHGLVDGRHIARFYEELERRLSHL